MIKRLNIASLRFTFSFSSIVKVIGVNSYVGEHEHILMWDFDHVCLSDVKDVLKVVQTRYFLSDVHIAKTKDDGGYHAFCFTTVDWQRAVEILAATKHIDMKYLKWSLFRGRFTLRVSEKMGRISHKVATLPGYQLPDVKIKDLKSWVIYETVGGGEWWHVQMRNMLSWFRPLTYLSRLRLPMVSGKKD